MRIKVIIILSVLLSLTALNTEILTYEKVLKNLKGINDYKDNKFDRSEESFNENSINHPQEGILHYNLGNSQYKNGKFAEAENSYKLALRDENLENSSDVFLNLGNTKFQQQDYKNALKNYRNSLIENPQNQKARYNYELASRFLQQQQQQQNQNNDQNKEEKQNKQKQNDEQQQKQDKDKQEQKQKGEQNQQQQQKKKEEMKKEKENAEKILKALLAKEKEEMKKEKRKMNVDKAKKGKYW